MRLEEGQGIEGVGTEMYLGAAPQVEMTAERIVDMLTSSEVFMMQVYRARM